MTYKGEDVRKATPRKWNDSSSEECYLRFLRVHYPLCAAVVSRFAGGELEHLRVIQTYFAGAEGAN